jgi:hypothetical protein
MAHKAEVTEVHAPADGMIAVRARCCGDQSTDSVLTIMELHREDAEIDQDIAAHLARVEKLHEARSRALAHIERLTKK